MCGGHAQPQPCGAENRGQTLELRIAAPGKRAVQRLTVQSGFLCDSRDASARRDPRKAAQLADPAFYASPDVAELRALARRQRDLSGLIELSEARWLAAQVELEAIGET